MYKFPAYVAFDKAHLFNQFKHERDREKDSSKTETEGQKRGYNTEIYRQKTCNGKSQFHYDVFNVFPPLFYAIHIKILYNLKVDAMSTQKSTFYSELIYISLIKLQESIIKIAHTIETKATVKHNSFNLICMFFIQKRKIKQIHIYTHTMTKTSNETNKVQH